MNKYTICEYKYGTEKEIAFSLYLEKAKNKAVDFAKRFRKTIKVYSGYQCLFVAFADGTTED